MKNAHVSGVPLVLTPPSDDLTLSRAPLKFTFYENLADMNLHIHICENLLFRESLQADITVQLGLIGRNGVISGKSEPISHLFFPMGSRKSFFPQI